MTFLPCPKHFYFAWPFYNDLIFIFGCWTTTTLYSFKAANLIMSLHSSHLSHFSYFADSKRRHRFHLNFVWFRADDPRIYSGHAFLSARISGWEIQMNIVIHSMDSITSINNYVLTFNPMSFNVLEAEANKFMWFHYELPSTRLKIWNISINSF